MKSGGLGLLMAWARVVLVFSAGSATFGQSSSTTQRPSATRPVKWVLYKSQDRNGSLHNLPLSWNEASLFCRERNGNLPSPNTQLSMSGFRAAIQSAFNSSAVLGSSLWIGLHRNGSGMPLNVWEKDCCVQPDCVSFLSPADQAGKFCSKMKTTDTQSGVWRLAYCTRDSKDVVCEFQLDKGDTALYQTHQNATLTVESHATADKVHSAEDCMSLCRPLRLGRSECIAAVFREKDSFCEMYIGTELMTVVKTEPSANSFVMVRDLFKYSTEVLPEGYSYTNSSVRKPSPAGYPDGCSSTEQVPCFQDFLPQGVRLKSQQLTANPSCGKSAICARLDERGYALKGEVRDFQCSQTSQICHNAVATAQSQDDLIDIIQCFCETNGTQGLVVRLRVAGEPSVVAGPNAVSNHTYSCTAPPAEPDCAGTCIGYSVIGCEVSCNSREVQASNKSVLCQTGTDRRGWPLCDDPIVTTEETLTTGTTTSPKRWARLGTMLLKSQPCCKCQAVPRAHNETTTTMDELKAQLAKELKDELTVGQSSLSKRRNEKISAPDQRTSSRVTGFSVLFVLVVVMALIVLSDISVLFRCPCCLRKVERKEKRGGRPHQTRS